MTGPTVRDTQAQLRMVGLALGVLVLGLAALCGLRPERATRVRASGQPGPVAGIASPSSPRNPQLRTSTSSASSGSGTAERAVAMRLRAFRNRNLQ